MFLTGYHGTSNENADNILKENKFRLSDSDKEWLGRGIYFYFNFEDAYEWRNNESILHSVIKIKDEEYLDIDTEEGNRICNGAIALLIKYNMLSNPKDKKLAQINQCAVMNYIWRLSHTIKVMSKSFPKEPKNIEMIMDIRPMRKEFCVRDNDCIKFTQRMKRSDIRD